MRTEIDRVELPHFVVRECAYPPNLRLPQHAHDYSNVTIVLSGSIDEAAGGREHRGQPFSVVFKPAGSEHENRVGAGGARTLTIELRDRSELAPVAAPRPWSWFEEPEVVRAALSVVRAADRTGLEASVSALLAEVMVDRAGGAAPPWLGEITRMIEARFCEPLRFDALARTMGLHPVYLSRAFQRSTGRTMQQYVRALRLQHARELLSTSGRTITAIAADAGFADSSHLCRTFADLLGITPGAYRGLARPSA